MGNKPTTGAKSYIDSTKPALPRWMCDRCGVELYEGESRWVNDSFDGIDLCSKCNQLASTRCDPFFTSIFESLKAKNPKVEDPEVVSSWFLDPWPIDTRRERVNSVSSTHLRLAKQIHCNNIPGASCVQRTRSRKRLARGFIGRVYNSESYRRSINGSFILQMARPCYFMEERFGLRSGSGKDQIFASAAAGFLMWSK